jgi:hypothetical protein
MFVENLIKSRLDAVGEQKINGLCTVSGGVFSKDESECTMQEATWT